nr:glutathione S-transferase C-terminal domain-containing protein homolog [Onthophagus taurus]XP_022903320.1 glutathione S-transferase C-terminal domain-containing protein homolog [Onthophagus taurus]
MSVYIEGSLTLVENMFGLSLESFIVYNLAVKCDVDVNLCVVDNEGELKMVLDLDKFVVINKNDIPRIGSYCKWPIVITNNKVVAGLCAVCRQIIKLSNNSNLKNLLGFKESCLMACSETSTWTKFCEVDIIKTTKDLLVDLNKFIENDCFKAPICFGKFEHHLNQPVRMHNIYKVARRVHNDKDLKSSLPIEGLNLNHLYAEGLYMTLADCIIYFCYKLIFTQIIFDGDSKNDLNLTSSWMKRMDLSELNINIDKKPDIVSIKKVILPKIKHTSLYSSEQNKYKQEISVTSEIIDDLNRSLHNLKISNNLIPFGDDLNFDWGLIPFNANPGAALPKNRSKRKCEQLENLAKSVLKIIQTKTSQKSIKIVDFCSGGGHLGILLSTLLPNSTIILVENKERSLEMALNRIKSLKLTNIQIVQSNLDYFIGKFNIGISLHACGVATDLVIQKSIDNKADFVCCPCCYGAIKNCHQISYPRSGYFKNMLSYDEYLRATRGADQTHDEENPKTKNGFRCMDIIDWDRKLYAEQFGYEVRLGKLKPSNCTVKNNLLVGILG